MNIHNSIENDQRYTINKKAKNKKDSYMYFQVFNLGIIREMIITGV